jgi:hypothetical protein
MSKSNLHIDKNEHVSNKLRGYDHDISSIVKAGVNGNGIQDGMGRQND